MTAVASPTQPGGFGTDAAARAAASGSATLYEANGQAGSLDPRIRAVVPDLSLAGPALTVRCQSGDNLTLHAAVAVARPGDVLVADVGGFEEAGHWGEILAVAAMARGIAGLVIDGGVRDAAALRRLGFPVYARGLCVRAATKELFGQIGGPIVCGGVRIEPGDLIVADIDGVVSISAGDVGVVLASAAEREAREAAMLDRLRGGELTLDLLGLRDRIAASSTEAR